MKIKKLCRRFYLLAYGLLSVCMLQAQDGACPSSSSDYYSNSRQWYREGTTQYAYTGKVSDWYCEFHWEYKDDDGDFVYIYDDATGSEPKMPLFSTDLTTYIGSRGQEDVFNKGYVPLGPNETWCFIPASSITGEADDVGSKYIKLQTNPAYSPQNFTIEEIGFTEVKVTWDKGTHAPDDKHEYILEANNGSSTTSVRVDGNTRAYTFSGLASGTTYSFRVKTHIPAAAFTYDSWAYNSSNASTSSARDRTATTQGLNVSASKGAFTSKVRLEWGQLTGGQASRIRVERSKLPPLQTQYEERATVNGADISFEDTDALPGYIYTYRISVLDQNNATVASDTETGYRKPNGIIRGEVRTINRTGVGGVRVCAIPKDPIPVAGAFGLPDPVNGYCTTTTVSGRFEIRNVYYYDSATFVITPFLQDHSFDPPLDEAVLDRNSSTQSGFSFTDTTAISIGGRVTFPTASTFGASGLGNIPVEGASILVDGTDYGLETDAQGYWKYALIDTGTFTFGVEYLDHSFAQDEISLFIDEDRTNLDFIDTQVDSIKIRAQDGCGDPVASTVKVNITYDGPSGQNLFQRSLQTDAQGLAEVIVPAAKLKVEVPNSNPGLDAAGVDPNIKTQYMASPFYFDLSTRDSVKIANSDTTFVIRPDSTVILPDTTFVIPGGTFVLGINNDSIWTKPQPRADFLYYGPIELWVDWAGAEAEIFPGCQAKMPGSSTDSVIVVQSGSYYPLEIYMVDAIKNCPVDTGRLVIHDYVGDQERTPISIPISNGRAMYPLVAGIPNTADGGAFPYQKPFFMYVYAGSRPGEIKSDWALVEGTQNLTPTFTTRSPEIPDLILHDPPGDASYAWVEKGSSREIFQTVQFQRSEEVNLGDGLWTDAVIGAKLNNSISILGTAGFNWSVGAGLVLEVDESSGVQQSHQQGYNFKYSFTENFSTSDDPLFTGNDGDVYIGKATNQRFSIAEVLLFDETACETSLEKRPNLELTGIATTFNYTEKHIEEVLIPQLDFLEISLRRQASREPDPSRKDDLTNQADSFMVDVLNWKSILAENARNRDTLAEFEQNISFAAGAPLERVIESSWDTVSTHEYLDFRDQSLKIGGQWIFDLAVWYEGSTGTYGKSRIVTMPKDKQYLNSDTITSSSMKVGYRLADRSYGDFFSVDVLKDLRYGVPAFKLFAGTSSCPHEEGTQARERAQISIYPPQIDNVPVGESAIFTASLTNKSENYESNEYHVRLIADTNPNGAELKLGGQPLVHEGISFNLDTLTKDIVLEVKQGPRANSYENIGIMIYPPCEYELWQREGDLTNGDTAWITVNFETECSAVSIVSPESNWFINSSTGTELVVDLGGYDASNKYLEQIKLQYKKEGTDWVDGPFVDVSALTGDLHRLTLDFDTLADGKYWLRAEAQCRNGKGITRSPEVMGIVDRNSMAPFGKPSPSDGFLRADQAIFVQFDQAIDTAISNINAYPEAPVISLIRTDNDEEIPFSIVWSTDSTRLQLLPAARVFADDELTGVEFQATVSGLRSGLSPNFEPQTYDVNWSFLFNQSPVFWEPDYVEGFMFTGFGTSVSSYLQNATGKLQRFTLADLPEWVIPTDTSGKINPYDKLELAFSTDPDLAPGVYTDTITALIDGFPEYLTLEMTAEAKQPNWQVNPGDYTYAMNAVIAFSLDQTDTNLSRDSMDLIAAFYNGEVRGLARLEYVERFDKYMAFMTIFSDIPANEEIKFRMWRASTGVIHAATETIYFAEQSLVGRIGQPQILHPNGIYQVIPLQQGWNWVSLNVENTDMTLRNLLGSLGSPQVGNNVTVKRKDGHTATFTQIATPIIYGNQWAGNLVEMNNTHGYMLHLSRRADTLYVPGQPITNFSSIDLFSGWNWIGYQPQKPQALSEALNSVNTRNQDLIVSQEAFSEYHKGTDTWYGPLQFMEPGKGYKMKLKDGRVYNDLVYARTTKEDFEVDHTRFASSMTVIASVGNLVTGSWTSEGSQTEAESQRLMIGAFIDDSCRGYGYLQWVEFLHAYRVIFSFAGNPEDIGRPVQFKIYDSFSGQEFIPDNEAEIFVSDRILGSMSDPYVLFERLTLPEKGYFLEQAFPNPFDSHTKIRYILPQEEQVSLRVFDQTGRLIKVLLNETQAAGEHQFVFDAAAMPAGVYYYNLKAGAFQASRKMVKM